VRHSLYQRLLWAARLAFRAIAVAMTCLLLVAGTGQVQAADDRVALVIGNSAYQSVARLPNAANDARLMARTLSDLGFTLVGGGPQLDLDKAAFDRVVQEFGVQLGGARVALFYYAGHGVQVRGSNYLLPVSANPTRETDVDFQMVDAQLVLRQMEAGNTKLNLLILDACRNNPFGGRGLRSAGGGLAQMQAPEGTLISYATQPGNVAADGSGGDSPFTKALVDEIQKPGHGIFEIFNQVGLTVKASTRGAQEPWGSSSPIEGQFFFVPPGSTVTIQTPPVSPAAQPPDAELLFWQTIGNSTDPKDFQAYLDQYPKGRFAALALLRATPRPQAPSAPQAGQADDATRTCDTLAASPFDKTRPAGVAGVAEGRVDTLRAIPACERAVADHPSPRLQFQLGRSYLDAERFDDAARVTKLAADQGFAPAQAALGSFYASGHGVKQSWTEAARLYKLAADQGFAPAQFFLGALYSSGHGVRQSWTEAARLYKLAAYQGNAGAQFNLGQLYESGAGVQQSWAEAARLYKLAADQGFELAKTRLQAHNQ
jgi:TPR repeat protein